MSPQRRVDRVLEAGYLDGLGGRPSDELAAMRTECVELETEYSFIRRLAQGRLDILDAEAERRRSGGSVADLVARLATILADEAPRPSPAQAHLPQRLAPSADIEWTRGLEPLVSDATLLRLPDLSDAELATARGQLAELERNTSDVRRSLHEVLRALETELAGRLVADRGSNGPGVRGVPREEQASAPTAGRRDRHPRRRA